MTRSFALAGLAVLVPALLAQDGPAPRVLTLEPPLQGAPGTAPPAAESGGGLDSSSETPPATPSGMEDLRVLLGQPDLDRRMEAFDSVARRLGDPALRAEVEALAQRSDELGWTARLLLRDAPRAQRPLRSGGLRPAPGGLRFQDLFDSVAPWPGFGSGSGSSSSASSVQVEQGPDGVRVEVRTTEDGEESTRVYEGESLEQLQEEHPELGEVMGGGGLRIDLGSGSAGGPLGGFLEGTFDFDFGGPGGLPGLEEMEAHMQEQLRQMEEQLQRSGAGVQRWKRDLEERLREQRREFERLDRELREQVERGLQGEGGQPLSLDQLRQRLERGPGQWLRNESVPVPPEGQGNGPEAADPTQPAPPASGQLRRLEQEMRALDGELRALEREFRNREPGQAEGAEGRAGSPSERPVEQRAAAEPLRLGVLVVDENGRMRVTSVEEGSRAASVGIQPGDLLLRLNGTEVRRPADVARRLRQILDGEGGFLGLEVEVETEAGERLKRTGC